MVNNKIKYNSVEEITVWNYAHEFVIEIYKITNDFPNTERFGIVSQLRRSAASIPANISEGFYRKTLKELIQFLYISRGSLGETKYFIKLSNDLGYITDRDYKILVNNLDIIGKQLNGWINSLNKLNNK